MFCIRNDNVLNDTLTIQSGIANDFEIQYDFPEYDKMEIEFVETEPNSRIHVDYISIGSETSYRIEYDDLYSTPVGTQLDRIKNVKVARYLYSKSSIEDELATETLTYDGENAIYYMSDACYGYTVSIEDGKSGQSAKVVSSGAYYVEIAVSGVAIGETVNITVKGYKYNVSTAYTVQTVNNRGTDKEWQNPKHFLCLPIKRRKKKSGNYNHCHNPPFHPRFHRESEHFQCNLNTIISLCFF